ncbi:PCI domain-containing protein 2 -like protein [Trichinella nativa]|uniref:CSN12-like protein n=1 Tax=Trichinella nativa TaxID=6335 RepID=A0A0V1LII8_9BILA|nr:PCI domain-containing protein 2 -like protein [Trichinella nativa]
MDFDSYDFTTIDEFFSSIRQWGAEGTWEYASLMKHHLTLKYPYKFLYNLDPNSLSGQAEKFFLSPFDEIFDMHLKCVQFCRADPIAAGLHGFIALLAEKISLRLLPSEGIGRFSIISPHLLCNRIVNQYVLQAMKDQNWFLPMCFQFCKNLRFLAVYADLRQNSARVPRSSVTPMQSENYHSEDAARAIMECYRSCSSDLRNTSETSKSLGLLNFTNCLFAIHIRTNRMNLLKPLIRAIDHCGSLFDQFSLFDQIVYKYYTGQRALIEWNLEEADRCLSFAFEQCPQHCVAARRMILTYLIPTKMFLGYMPSKKLLEYYDFQPYVELSEAVKEGNLYKLRKTIELQLKFFAKKGIVCCIMKLDSLCHRIIVKRVAAILNTHKIPMEYIRRAFLFSNKNIDGIQTPVAGDEWDTLDLDEIECYLTNLIYDGKVKGYIAHMHQRLVISRDQPFPPLTEATWQNKMLSTAFAVEMEESQALNEERLMQIPGQSLEKYHECQRDRQALGQRPFPAQTHGEQFRRRPVSPLATQAASDQEHRRRRVEHHQVGEQQHVVDRLGEYGPEIAQPVHELVALGERVGQRDGQLEQAQSGDGGEGAAHGGLGRLGRPAVDAAQRRHPLDAHRQHHVGGPVVADDQQHHVRRPQVALGDADQRTGIVPTLICINRMQLAKFGRPIRHAGDQIAGAEHCKHQLWSTTVRFQSPIVSFNLLIEHYIDVVSEERKRRLRQEYFITNVKSINDILIYVFACMHTAIYKHTH